MATVTAKGEIGRVFFDGKGAEVVEKFTVRGSEVTVRWSAFFDQPHGLEVGSVVEVTGLHGDKSDSWPDKGTGEIRHGVKRTINKARVIGSPVSSYNDETPF